MKKKTFKLILILCLLMIVSLENVSADGSGYPGIGGTTHPCGTGYCYDARTGVRVSLVYGPDEAGTGNTDNFGKRCNYDATNKTICSEDGAGSGIQTKSIDIWFTNKLADMGSGTFTLASSKKMTKQEFIADTSKNYGAASIYYKNDSYLLKEVTSLSFLGLNDSNDILVNGGKHSASHINNFVKHFILPVLEIDDLGEVKSSTKWSGYTFKDAEGKLTTAPIWNTLIGLMTNGNLDYESLSSKKYIYVQFDQLIQYGYFEAAGNVWHDSVIGTVAEVTYYWQNKSKNRQSWCVSKKKSDLLSGSFMTCSDYMVDSGYTNGWYSPASGYSGGGGVTTRGMALGLSHGPQPAPGQGFETFYKDDTKNVAYYWLNHASSSECEADEDLHKLLKDGPGAEDLKTLIEKFELKFVSDSSVKIKYNTPVISSISDSFSRMSEFIIKAFGLPKEENIDEACYEEMDCNTIAKNIFYCYKKGKSIGVDGIDLGINCSANSSEYETLLKELASYYGLNYDTSLLNETIYKSVGKTNPSCGNNDISDECKTNIPPISCGNKFTFKDASDKDKCWSQGIAYKTDSGTTATSLEQETEHDDASCVRHGCSGSHTCKTYCYEEVEFRFPDAPGTTKAGQVFKWGTDGSAKPMVFGTMTITKKCTSNSKGNDCRYHSSCEWHCHKSCKKGGCCSGATDNAINLKGFKPKSFDYNDWKDVETKVELIYQEPTDSSLSRTEELITQHKGGTGSYNPPVCTSENSDCTNDPIHTMTNEYEFLYPEELNWSSYKVDNSLQSNITDKNYYYHIGYGLPTAFTTPDGKYGPDNGEKGQLTARITNIGAKQTMESGNRYDKLVDGTDIEYSCEFEIHNELYDYECYDESGNLRPGHPDYCDPSPDDDPKGKRKGIDVVFRTIELMGGATDEDRNRAFPGKTGGGRFTGSNWMDLYNNVTDLHKVLDGSVYSKDPQYEIKLTVSSIQKIRQYNKSVKSAGIDPYTEMTENSSGDYGFVCVDNGSGDYKHCASNFITTMQGLGLTGTCLQGGGTNGRANYYKDGGCQQS